MIILNVGLKIDALGDEFNTYSICMARASLIQGYFVRIGYSTGMQVAQSNTEHTAIIELRNAIQGLSIESVALELSAMLGQDCIAVYFPDDDYGALIGINAEKWGEFNKDYFLMP